MEAAKFMVSRAQAGLFLDPGLRKTSIVLAVLRALYRKKLARRALVVAPPRVCESVWTQEAAKWQEFSHLTVVNLHGAKKDELLELEADIYLVSYQSLDWIFDVKKTKDAKGKTHVKVSPNRVRDLGFDVLVCDELSKARNTNSLTFKILREVRDQFAYVYGMTGSPAPKSLLNLFGLMYVIDGGYSLGAYITHYRANYFYPSGYGGYDYQLQPGADKRIYEAIAPLAFRLDAKDFLKLPQLVENVVKVQLPPAARKVYDAMEKDFFAEVEDRGFAAVNGRVTQGKCRQIANGGLYEEKEIDDEGAVVKGPRKWVELHQEKAEAVMDMLEELDGSPALVVYEFQHDLDRLRRVLGKDVPHIGGGVSAKEGNRIVEAWNRGELPVLLVHPASMSHGLNMQGADAHHVLWHSLTWDFEAKDQLIRRLLRSGNRSSHVFSHQFVAEDTVDELMVVSTAKKEANQKALNDALREYTLKRKPKLRKLVRRP